MSSSALEAIDSRIAVPSVPPVTAIMKFCMGNASVTAVSAASSIRETKIESTMLYRACTSMENIMGVDIVRISRRTGMTPILFSVLISLLIASPYHPLPAEQIIITVVIISFLPPGRCRLNRIIK